MSPTDAYLIMLPDRYICQFEYQECQGSCLPGKSGRDSRCSISLFAAERKRALDGAVHEGHKFQTSLQDMLQWMTNVQDSLDDTDPVSGDRDVLVKQALEQEASSIIMMRVWHSLHSTKRTVAL